MVTKMVTTRGYCVVAAWLRRGYGVVTGLRRGYGGVTAWLRRGYGVVATGLRRDFKTWLTHGYNRKDKF